MAICDLVFLSQIFNIHLNYEGRLNPLDGGAAANNFYAETNKKWLTNKQSYQLYIFYFLNEKNLVRYDMFDRSDIIII